MSLPTINEETAVLMPTNMPRKQGESLKAYAERIAPYCAIIKEVNTLSQPPQRTEPVFETPTKNSFNYIANDLPALQKLWDEYGYCGSCSYHDSISSYGSIYERWLEMEETDKRLELACHNETEDDSNHRGVRIPKSELDKVFNIVTKPLDCGENSFNYIVNETNGNS